MAKQGAGGPIVVMMRREVCDLLCVSPMRLNEWVKQGMFPPPVKQGKFAGWLAATVLRWFEKREAEAQAEQRKGVPEAAARAAERREKNTEARRQAREALALARRGKKKAAK
jgi:predicted DNA-binding transcriptional regulator AlpA